MRRLMFVFILFLASPHQADAGIRRWDALPAVDVMHLQGPYAGRSVCPMCQHGYDAGVLVFLPSTINPASAARVARQMRLATAAVNDHRFRPFLIFTGESPSPALLAAVKDSSANWYVAHLATSDLPAASRDFRLPLAGRSYGYVFSQRRLLASFNPQSAESPWIAVLSRHAHYAMSFLRVTYSRPTPGATPDTPKGRLWSAPGELDSTIAFAKSPQQSSSRLCFADLSQLRLGDALVAFTTAAASGPARVWWARTDGRGCVNLVGVQGLVARLRAEVFGALKPVASAVIETSRLSPGSETQVLVQSASAARVTGKEVVAAPPCEGCEHVFVGLPVQISSVGKLAPPTQAGERLQVSGTVRNSAGVVQADVVVYAYQTDASGRYPPGPTRHGALRGWARTDTNGKYGFATIRPGSYPGSDIPQHIHMHIIEPGRCTYYIGDIVFTDDPFLTPARRLHEENARGGSGIARPAGNKRSGWTVTRDITLGLNVPGYDTCSR